MAKEGDLLDLPDRLRSLPKERERDLELTVDAYLRRRLLDRGSGEGLRGEREGVRLLWYVLGEREREASEGVKDLARSSPRSGFLRGLPFPDPLRTGDLDLTGE